MAEALIKIRQLKIAFGATTVLDEMDLDVYEGETLAIIGPSGAGKSTIMKVLTGLLRPTSGSVVIKGEETAAITEEDRTRIRRSLGVVFQYSALFDFLTVGENVAFGLRRHFKLPEAEIRRTVSTLLELVGLPGTENMQPQELSGGMKKRVGLARALAMHPQIVYYDEPTSGLDPVMTMAISRLIRTTQQRLGLTSILITHDMESVFYVADRIAMLYKGKIVEINDVEGIKNSTNPIVKAFINGQELKKEDGNGQ